MQFVIDRRRFVVGAASLVGLPLVSGCGGASAGGDPMAPVPLPPVPQPNPSPMPPASPAAFTIALAGSSSPAEYLNLYAGPPTIDQVTSLAADGSFQILQQGAFCKQVGSQVYRETGRPVRYIGGGAGGTTVAEWAAVGSKFRAAFVSRVRSIGSVDAILLQVGRNDAANLIIKGYREQSALFKGLIADIRSETGLPECPIFIGSSQNYPYPDPQYMLQIGWQRLAELLAIRDDRNTKFGFSTYDLATRDGVHQTEASQLISGSRFARQLIASIKSGEPTNGPQVVQLVRLSETRLNIVYDEKVVLPPPGLTLSGLSISNGRKVVPVKGLEVIGGYILSIEHDSVSTSDEFVVSYAIEAFAEGRSCLRGSGAEQLPAMPYYSRLNAL